MPVVDIRITRMRWASVMKNLLVQYAVIGRSAAALPHDGKPFRYYFFEDRVQEACQPTAMQKGQVQRADLPGSAGRCPAKRKQRIGRISTLGTSGQYAYAHAHPTAAPGNHGHCDNILRQLRRTPARESAARGSVKPGRLQSSAASSRRLRRALCNPRTEPRGYACNSGWHVPCCGQQFCHAKKQICALYAESIRATVSYSPAEQTKRRHCGIRRVFEV